MKLPTSRSALWLAIAVFGLTFPGEVASAGKDKGGAQTNDRRYTAGGLRAAFATLCQRLGYRALIVEIEQSEFPFLVHGVLAGNCDYKAIRDELRSMPDYSYAGCVTAVRGDGSKTIFVLNMIPQSEYRRDQRELMYRMQDLARTYQ
jgi:hypothetical protein